MLLAKRLLAVRLGGGLTRLPAILAVLLLLSCMGLLPTARADETVSIVTEQYPPYNYVDQGKLGGLCTEVVQAVLHELKLKGDFKLLPWARAYGTALRSPNVLIYSISRTPDREHLFKWVGVIAPTDFFLYAVPGKDLGITTLDEAKPYQIGTVNEDVGEQFLIKHGFTKGTNLQSIASYEANYQKLQRGRVDLWIMAELSAVHLARQAGHDPAKTLTKVLHIPEMSGPGTYMAFGNKTPDATVAQFRAGLDAIKKNGTFDALTRKWLGG